MMSGRDMENCNIYRGEIPFNMENEPEDGEIVDDYDLISSDEELSMRQRIRELEAENEEIEQIAVISGSYIDKINHPQNLESSRAAQVLSDASSISSTEFVTPKKRKRRKSREHKRKHCHRQHQHEHNHHHHKQYLHYDAQQLPLKHRLKRSYCKRRQKLFTKRYKEIHSDRFINKDLYTENLLKSEELSESSSLTDVDNYSHNRLEFNRKEIFNNEKYITRDTLRLAVARNTNESRISELKKSCLKDKLLRQDFVAHSLNSTINKRQSFAERDNIHVNNNDDDVQVIENEQDIHTVDEDSADSMEEKELRLIALKSAVLKKHMARKMRNAEVAYSPTDFDEMLSSEILRNENRLNDIHVVDLEADDSQTACATVSPETSPQLMMLDDLDESQQIVDCKPVDMDIANSDSEDATIDSWSKDIEHSLPKFSLESQDFINNQYSFYIQELHELPPPPPAVDDYEDVPPPPPCMLYNAESQDMDLDNEELADDQRHMEKKVKDIQRGPDKTEEEEVEDKEEEEALRALLLSKFQAPKSKRKMKKSNEGSEGQETSNKSEIILKEAVKRLKIHSQTELCKEEKSVSFCNKSKCGTDNEIQEHPENCNASLNPLQKSRNDLNKCANESQFINSDHIENRNQNLLEQKDVEETVANHSNEHTIMSNSISTIDISDITRRLQKIKENVLNLNSNLPPHDPPPNINSIPHSVDVTQSSSECFEVTDNVIECNQCPLENICEVSKPLTNNSINIISANNELSTALAKRKTVKANFDVASNHTTFKVTIANNTEFKLEDNEITNSLNDVTYKENDTSNGSKNLSLKINGNTRSKVALSTERLVKITNKTTELSGENNVRVTKSFSVAKQIVNENKVTVTPTCSSLRTAKIVKPNKVINANFELNLKQRPQVHKSTLMLKISKPETNSQLSNASDNPRLITSIDQVKHMCVVAPIVISMRNSSNESSDDERGGVCDSLYKPLHDYNDNASPLSLNLESPSRTPLRSNSPTESNVDGNTKHTESEVFNLKTKKSMHRENVIDKIPQTNLAVQGEQISKTPLAVRHLPAEAQSEYRRLVHRMKLLENKRKLDDIEESRTDCTNTNYNNFSTTKDSSKEKDKADSVNSELKASLVKKVLLKNASNNTTSAAIITNNTEISNGSSSSSKLHKSNVLRSYENLYIKFGAGIVNNLDKSLKLVQEAKNAKIAKLKLENRLKELKAEMDNLQAKHKEEQQKITRIYPSICATNEVITSLKQKRSKIFKAALNLGKTLNGEVYRLSNDLKESITTKSKKLATEIKIVNSLKAQDIINVDDVINTNTTEPQADNKQKKIEDYVISCNGESIEIKAHPKTDINSTMVCSENGKKKEENNPESPLKKEFSGNIESLEPNNSKSHNNTSETCRLENGIKLNNADSEKGSNQTSSLSSYISPLDHLRNIDSNVDPNGVICPYDLMGNCEDLTCKYVHITPKAKT